MQAGFFVQRRHGGRSGLGAFAATVVAVIALGTVAATAATVHFSFADWPQANAATHTYLDTATPIGRGYRAAPHLFYFAPQNLWYMVYQTGLPTYSTSTDPSNPDRGQRRGTS